MVRVLHGLQAPPWCRALVWSTSTVVVIVLNMIFLMVLAEGEGRGSTIYLFLPPSLMLATSHSLPPLHPLTSPSPPHSPITSLPPSTPLTQCSRQHRRAATNQTSPGGPGRRPQVGGGPGEGLRPTAAPTPHTRNLRRSGGEGPGGLERLHVRGRERR